MQYQVKTFAGAKSEVRFEAKTIDEAFFRLEMIFGKVICADEDKAHPHHWDVFTKSGTVVAIEPKKD